MKRVAVVRRAFLAGLLLCGLALSPWTAWAGGKAAEPGKWQKVAAVEGVTEYRLPNGVRFLLFPDPASSKITVNMTVLVGSRHEGYGETGMAHLLEHMLFKGSRGFPNMDKALQEHGANKTANATTWLDRTNYFETMSATDKNLEFGIRFEADRLVNAFIKREDLVKEMTVVRNEFEQGENSPDYVLSQRMMAVAYEWHNYGKATIGNRSDIERVPIDRLQAFYRKYYRPDNIVLIVAGKFDEGKALDYIGKYFGAVQRPERPLDRTYTDEPPQDGERSAILRRVGKVPLVGAIYHIPAGSDPEYGAVAVLNTALVSEPAGLLYKALVETKKASSVSGSSYALHDPGVTELTATVGSGIAPEEVRDIMLDTLEKQAKAKISAEEVEKAKRKILAGYDRVLTRSTAVASQLSEWSAAGDWRLFFLHRDRVAKVTLEDVRAAAGKYLRRTNRTLGVYYPTAEATKTTIPQPPPIEQIVKDYKGGKSVAAGEAFDPTSASIEARVKRLTLPGGLKVALLSKKTRGEAVVGQLSLRFGNPESLKGQAMAAGFIGPLMMRGTQKRSYQEIQDQLDLLKAHLGASSGAGRLAFGLQAKRDTLPKLLELLGDVLRNPTFPDPEFGIMRREDRQELEKSLVEPRSLAVNALRRHLNPYPPDSLFYVPTIPESIKRLDAVTRDQVVKIYREQIGAQAGELVLVGDFDADATVKQVQALVGDWKAQVPYQRAAKKAATKTPGGFEEILTPEKENSVYLGGYLFDLSDTSPDYPAMRIGNYITGASGLNSRIFGRLRNEEGLVYGAGSSFGVDPRDHYASFTVNAITKPENIGKVAKLVREELDRLLKDGVTQKELDAAQAGFLQEQKVARGSDGALAGQLLEMLDLNRTYQFVAEQEDRVRALTVADVNRALRAYLTPNRLFIVHAGDFKKAKRK